MFFDNGQLEQTQNWKDGKLNGEVLLYYKNGQLVKIEYWKDGVLINN